MDEIDAARIRARAERLRASVAGEIAVGGRDDAADLALSAPKLAIHAADEVVRARLDHAADGRAVRIEKPRVFGARERVQHAERPAARRLARELHRAEDRRGVRRLDLIGADVELRRAAQAA
jgi:hypothetical protein